MTNLGKNVDPFGQHEALDRTSTVLRLFDMQVLGHPAVTCDADLLAKAKTASSALGELYQAIGRRNALADGQNGEGVEGSR